MLAKIPLSLYIHFPWCVKKCPYCDFNSYACGKNHPNESNYIQALLLDLENDLAFYNSCNQIPAIESIFMGGGTPSLFSPHSIAHLLDEIQKRAPLKRACEITIEANPGTFDLEKMNDFREAGINRLSIGIQSFDDKKLKALGRIHDSEIAKRAVYFAQEAGFTNLNLDLMFGLSGQSVKGALSDLQQAIALNPSHLSWYQLTIEQGTPFFHKRLKLPCENALMDMHKQGQDLLQEQGFFKYEISGYAKANCQCQHNLNYWRFGDYLGIGAGAHGKLTQTAPQAPHMAIFRTEKCNDPNAYMKNPRTQFKKVAKNDLPLEFMMNVLRLKQGAPLDFFKTRTGLPLETISKQLQSAQDQNFISLEDGYIRPTEKGLLFLNNCLECFID